MQRVKLTHEEQIEMYMKCSKRELAEMLTKANRSLDKVSGRWPYVPTENTTTSAMGVALYQQASSTSDLQRIDKKRRAKPKHRKEGKCDDMSKL